MSLRDKLLNETHHEREARERQEAEERSHSVVHKMVEAMRSLCHLVANDFLGEYEKERLATIRRSFSKACSKFSLVSTWARSR